IALGRRCGAAKTECAKTHQQDKGCTGEARRAQGRVEELTLGHHRFAWIEFGIRQVRPPTVAMRPVGTTPFRAAPTAHHLAGNYLSRTNLCYAEPVPYNFIDLATQPDYPQIVALRGGHEAVGAVLPLHMAHARPGQVESDHLRPIRREVVEQPRARRGG